MPGEQKVGMAEILRRKMAENESLAQQAAQQLNQKGTAQPGSLDKMLRGSKGQGAASHPATLDEVIAMIFPAADREGVDVKSAVHRVLQAAHKLVNKEPQQQQSHAAVTLINQAPQANAQVASQSGQAGSDTKTAITPPKHG